MLIEWGFGLVLGAVSGWLLRNRKCTKLSLRILELEELSKTHQSMQEMETRLSNTFQSLSRDALQKNNATFLDLAKQNLEKYQESATGDLKLRQSAIGDLLGPIKEQLKSVDGTLKSLEKERAAEYSGIKEQVKNLVDLGQNLRGETENLTRALRVPNVRGRWGEIQLKRVVELAGMVAHCDFYEQQEAEKEGRRIRPDLVVKLPNEKTLIVDSKTPLKAYLESIEAKDEKEQALALKEHARQVRQHLMHLSGKAYWDQFESSPEFVILFLPGESFFSAALEQDPSLLEYGVDNRVILATPTTLIALLQAVAYGWRQETVTKNAQKVCLLGKELHERMLKLTDHFGSLKKGIHSTVDSYNQLMGSFERRVMPTARKFEELGVAKQELPPSEGIEKVLR